MTCIEPNPQFLDDRELGTGCDSQCHPTHSESSTADNDDDVETDDVTSSTAEPDTDSDSSDKSNLSTSIETSSTSDPDSSDFSEESTSSDSSSDSTQSTESDSNSSDSGTETEIPSPVFIDFDEDGPAMDYFSEINGPTSDEYQDFGIYFEGPRTGDGAAVISDDTWPISGHTPPNIFGFNCGMRFQTGGSACGPITILFSPPATRVTMLAGTGAVGVRINATAYDELGGEVDAHEMPIGNVFARFTLEGDDIARIVFDGSGSSRIVAIDDLEVSYEK